MKYQKISACILLCASISLASHLSCEVRREDRSSTETIPDHKASTNAQSPGAADIQDPEQQSFVITHSPEVSYETFMVATGSQLYTIYCESCHGGLDTLGANPKDPMTFKLLDKDLGALKRAIESVPQMNNLKSMDLNDRQLELIAEEIRKIPVPDNAQELEVADESLTSAIVSGMSKDYTGQQKSAATMYEIYCSEAGCHGNGSAHNIQYKDFAAFAQAKANVPAMAERLDLNSLTKGQIDDIFTYLAK